MGSPNCATLVLGYELCLMTREDDGITEVLELVALEIAEWCGGLEAEGLCKPSEG